MLLSTTPPVQGPPPPPPPSDAPQTLVPLTCRPLYRATPRNIDAGVDLGQKLLKMGRVAKLAASWTPDQVKDYVEKVKESVVAAQNRYSSLSVKRRTEMTALQWECFLCLVLPQWGEIDNPIPRGELWLASTVKAYAHYFLPGCINLFKTTSGSYVSAKTLYSWFQSFISVINRYCTDPEDGQLAGPTLLLAGGLHNILTAQVEELVVTFDLRRELKPLVMLGISELQIMIEEVLMNTSSSNRCMGILRIIEMLLCFYTAARPSSISSANSRTTAERKYPFLRHAHWIRNDPTGFDFTLVLGIHNFKGYNQARAAMQNFTLTSPTLPQHVIFDLPTLMLYYYFIRGALPIRFKTWEDVVQTDLAEIRVRDDMADKPMFVKCRQGTGEWTAEPREARSVSESISSIAQNAGLPKGTAYGFRKGAAEQASWPQHYQLQGRGAAELMLNHTSSGDLLARHYISGTNGLAPVELRLGTLGITDPTFEAVTKQRALTSQAVYAILKRKDWETDDNRDILRNRQTHNIKLTKQDRQDALTNDPAAREANEAFNECWQAWVKFYNMPKEFRPSLTNRAKIERFGVRPEYNLNDPKTKALIDDAQEALTTAASACTSANRKAVRPLKRQKNLDARNDYDVNTTVTARNAAVEVAARKSGIVDELIALVHENHGHRKDQTAERDAVGPEDSDHPADYNDDTTQDMDDGICGNDPDDLFAVVDLSDEQDDIATELWNHPGVQDTVNHLNRIAQINKARFNGRTIKKPVSNQSKHMHSGDTPQEVYTLPSEANQFPQVSMGNLRKEFIEFVRRPIEFERQINEQYKADGDKWYCQPCKKYLHIPEKANHSFPRRLNLVRHMQETHDIWADLEVAMLPKQFPASLEHLTFRCPSGDLSGAATVKEVRKHMTSSCVQSGLYKAFQEKHNANRRHRTDEEIQARTSKGKHHPVNSSDEDIPQKGKGRRPQVISSDEEENVSQKGKNKAKVKPFTRIDSQRRESRAHDLVELAFSQNGGGFVEFMQQHKVDPSSILGDYAALADDTFAALEEHGGFSGWKYKDE